MKRKLQVFVSSTYLDLKNERQAAVEAILKAGHHPAGMELFTAGDKSQMEVIRQWIDESDVYMLILGGRYGSIEPESGLSYTELGYEYALSQYKRVFSVVIREEGLEEKIRASGSACMEKSNPQFLERFRSKVLQNMSSFFSDLKDIKLSVHESLANYSNDKNLTGWVPGNILTDLRKREKENEALSKNNAMLARRIKELERSLDLQTSDTFLEELLKSANAFQAQLSNFSIRRTEKIPGSAASNQKEAVRAEGVLKAAPTRPSSDPSSTPRNRTGICIVADTRLTPQALFNNIGAGGNVTIRLRVVMRDPPRQVDLNLGEKFNVNQRRRNAIAALPGVLDILDF